MTIRYTKTARGLAALALVAWCAETMPAMAQQFAIEEIVVTARKRDESIQDIPIAITAFTAADIQKRNFQEMTDIALFTPGFNFENFGNEGGTAPVIRGATQVAGNIEQNVSFFFDGVYLPRGYITDLGFANIERVEIVKGPQSARYGRNAFMGAVNYISKKPTEEWTADGRVTIGNFGRFDGAAVVSGAIIPDVLRIRASIDYSEYDGSWKNSHPFADIDFKPGTNRRLGGYEKTIMSGAVQVLPTEDLEINLSYMNYDFDREHSAQNWFGELNADSQLMNCGQFNPDVRPAGAGGFGFGGQWFRLFCGELPARGVPIDPRGYAQQLDLDFLRGSLSWDVTDDFSFEYIYGRIEADTFTFGFKDTLPGCTFFIPGLCVFENGPIGEFSTSSHDARVVYDNGGAINAAFGIYVYRSTDFSTSNFAALGNLSAVPTTPIDVLDPSQFIIQVALRNIITQTRAWSPFGEINFSFMEDRARLGIEARYSHDRKNEFNLASGGGEGVADFGGIVLTGVFTSFTPRVTLEYDLTDDSLIFASAAKGVKSGGFNGTATLEKNLTFDNDSNWTYELGSKNTFNDGQIQLNATLFLIEWSNVQIVAQDEGNPNPLPISIVLNLGEVSSKGIEFEGAIAASENLSFNGSLYYGDSNYQEGTTDLRWARIPAVCDDVVCSTSGDIGGNQMERQSKFQASLGAEWAGQLPGNMDLDYYIRADLGYQSKMFAEAVNLAWIQARTLVNASTGISGEWYDVQLWVRNLFDKSYVANTVVQSPNSAYNAYFGERQTFGLTFTAHY